MCTYRLFPPCSFLKPHHQNVFKQPSMPKLCYWYAWLCAVQKKCVNLCFLVYIFFACFSYMFIYIFWYLLSRGLLQQWFHQLLLSAIIMTSVQSLLLCIHDTLLCKSTNMWPGILREVKNKKDKINKQPAEWCLFLSRNNLICCKLLSSVLKGSAHCLLLPAKGQN